MLNDPLTSYFRIEKSFKRLALLQKHYPVKLLKEPISQFKVTNDKKDKVKEVIDFVLDFLKDNTDTILIGDYAYNYFNKESNLKKDYIKELDINRLDFIMAEYVRDGKKLIKILREKFGENKIKVIEFYPFYQFTGSSAIISYDGISICRFYHHNDKCLTFQNIKYDKSTLQIGTFNLVVMFYMIHMINARVNKEKEKMHNMNVYISHLFQMRNHYLKSNKKNIFDDTPFVEFTIKCVGETMEPSMERTHRIKDKLAKGKRPFWTYRPENDKKEPESNYIYDNTSGNMVNNPKNLRLAK
jgi:hypothetical protein